MRIHHVITRLVAGGAQQNTLLCAQQQAREGHEVTLTSGLETGSEGSLLEEARTNDFRFLESKYLVREINPLKDLLALFELIRFMRLHPADICHTHTSKAGILGRLAAKICGVPVIVHTPHGHVFHSYFSKSKTLLFKVLERSLARVATDGLIALTNQELREHEVEKIAPSSQMWVIPSGVAIDDFTKLNRPSNDSTVLGYVGRLADIKGPLDLLEAFLKVRRAHGDAKLLVVGDGPLREQIELVIAQNQLQQSVTLVGWQQDVRPYLEQMDMLVVPSHNEGMGRVVVEAMAAGLPVVATAVGGLLDLVQEGRNGRLCPTKDPERLAETIVSLIENPQQRAEMGEFGKQFARSFSDKVMFQRLNQLYERLLRMRATPTTTNWRPV